MDDDDDEKSGLGFCPSGARFSTLLRFWDGSRIPIGDVTRPYSDLAILKILFENVDNPHVTFYDNDGKQNYRLAGIDIPYDDDISAYDAFKAKDVTNVYYARYKVWRSDRDAIQRLYERCLAAWIVVAGRERIALDLLFRFGNRTDKYGMAQTLANHIRYYGGERSEWLFVFYIRCVLEFNRKHKGSKSIIPKVGEMRVLQSNGKRRKCVPDIANHYKELLDEYHHIVSFYEQLKRKYSTTRSKRPKKENPLIFNGPKALFEGFSTEFGTVPSKLGLSSYFYRDTGNTSRGIIKFMRRLIWHLYILNEEYRLNVRCLEFYPKYVEPTPENNAPQRERINLVEWQLFA